MSEERQRSNRERDRAQRPRPQQMMGRGPHGMGGARIERAKDVKGALSRLIRYLGTYKSHLVAVALLTILSSLLSLAGPYLIGLAIDNAILIGDLGELVRITLLLAGIYLFSAIVSIASGWVMAIVSQNSLKKLRKELFEHIQTLNLSFFDKRSTGDLMSRLTNDIDSIGTAISQNMTQLINSFVTMIGIVVVMFSLNMWLALASLIVFPFVVVLTVVVSKKTRSSFRDLMMNRGMLNSIMQETISGQRVIIAFEQQESVNRKFTSTNDLVKAVSIKANTYSMLIMPLIVIFNNASIAIVAGIGSWMTLQGLATVGLIATFLTYSRRFADPIRQFSNIYNSIQSALAGAERIFEVIDTMPELTDAPNAINMVDFEGEVEFNDVDFEYVTDVPVLKDVSLKADPGQIIALVGPTGAGKTTIVNLLTRFYDVQGGSIKIDGLDIRKIRKDDIRSRLGLVLQDVFLFSGTVMDNIKYGRLDATDEECIQAAKFANADGFIRRLPQGYDTELSERANNLSHGQRQLISIARALVANPAILVLDEATSSVDTRTEIQIQEAFQRLMRGRTSFVIAHRLSTIRRADMVLVINEGEIVERGTHRELLEKKGFYHRIYMSQFKGTSGKEDLIRLTPPERPAPRFHLQGMPDVFFERIFKMVEIFRKKGATSPETALPLNDLRLPPMFSTMMQGPIGQFGLFVENNGKYYLDEEQLKQMHSKN